MQTMGIA